MPTNNEKKYTAAELDQAALQYNELGQKADFLQRTALMRFWIPGALGFAWGASMMLGHLTPNFTKPTLQNKNEDAQVYKLNVQLLEDQLAKQHGYNVMLVSQVDNQGEKSANLAKKPISDVIQEQQNHIAEIYAYDKAKGRYSFGIILVGVGLGMVLGFSAVRKKEQFEKQQKDMFYKYGSELHQRSHEIKTGKTKMLTGPA